MDDVVATLPPASRSTPVAVASTATSRQPQCQCGSGQTGVASAELAPSPAAAPSQAAAISPYVYAIGTIEARFPTLSIEKEFSQAKRNVDSAGLTDRQVFHATLSAPENRYITRQLGWVLVVQGMDTYLLRPHFPSDFDLLVEAVRPEPNPLDLDVVIGTQVGLATPEMCNGLIVPVVSFDQIYSFDRPALISQVPRSSNLTDDQNDAAVAEVLDVVLRLADNAGAIDEHRALNYLTMRYADIYNKTADQFASDFSLTGVEVRPSELGGDRNIVLCIFHFTNRQNAFVEKFAVSVDVTEKFPFLFDRLKPYFDRM